MAEFGWAYVGGGAVTASGGEIGSLQYKTGDQSISGSSLLTYDNTSAKMFLTGTLIVSGTIEANNYDIINTSVTEIDVSGNTNFGDSNSDTHTFTGSLNLMRQDGQHIMSASNDKRQLAVLGFAGGYQSVAAAIFTSSTSIMILGVSASNSPEPSIRIHNAATAGSGALLIIKDEISGRSGGINLTASSGQFLDGSSTYRMTGSAMTAINLYSNGHDRWFIF